MTAARGGARAWGLGVVAAAHALLLGWAWASSLRADAPGRPAPAVLVAQLLAPARAETAPAPTLPPPREAAPPPAGAPLAVPEPLPAAWAAPVAPVTAVVATAVAAPAGGDAAAPSSAGDAAALALASPRVSAPQAPPAPPPAAAGRTPADHAGCADVPHPLALRERGIEGQVQLRVQVGSDGRARQVQLLGSSGWRLFDEAALAKARSCRFRPALDGDTAVESWVEFPVRFALTQS